MLIDSENMLLRFLPNSVRPAVGEPSLFERVEAELEAAEKWPETEGVMSLDMVQESMPLYSYVLGSLRSIVANEALRCAMPKLNLVLTPNGLGVVSNNNLTPASRERTEALMRSFVERRDRSLNALLRWLGQCEEWIASGFSATWRRSLFPGLTLSSYNPATPETEGELSLTRWRSLIDAWDNAERSLAEEYISMPVLNQIRAKIQQQEVLSPEEWAITAVMREQASRMVAEKPIMQKTMLSCVNIIRNSPALQPIWAATTTAGIYANINFKNTRESGGYFF